MEARYQSQQNSPLDKLEQLLDLEIKDLRISGLANLIDKMSNFLQHNFGPSFSKAEEYLSNESIDPEMLDTLSEYPSTRIRKMVYAHENISGDTLEKMYKDKKNSFIRPMNYLMHPAVTGEKITRALKDIDQTEMGMVLSRNIDDLPFSLLKDLAFVQNVNYWSFAEGEVNMSEYAKELIVDKIENLHNSNVDGWALELMAQEAENDLELFAIASHKDASGMARNTCVSKIEKLGIPASRIISPHTKKMISYDEFAVDNLEMYDFEKDDRPLLGNTKLGA